MDFLENFKAFLNKECEARIMKLIDTVQNFV